MCLPATWISWFTGACCRSFLKGSLSTSPASCINFFGRHMLQYYCSTCSCKHVCRPTLYTAVYVEHFFALNSSLHEKKMWMTIKECMIIGILINLLNNSQLLPYHSWLNINYIKWSYTDGVFKIPSICWMGDFVPVHFGLEVKIFSRSVLRHLVN